MAKIILVDDDRDLAHLTKTVLLRHGHDVLVYYNALKAIEQAKREKPDLILMDIMLPEVSGAQAVKMLKKIPELNDVPVIFLTALVASEEDIEKTGINIENRVYRTLGKPYEITELLKIIESIMGKIQDKK